MSFPRYPEYKDSGVEWLGEVPGHWRVLRLKHLLKSIEQGWSPQCEAVPVESSDEWGVLKVGCVNGGVFNALENKALPSELEPIPSLGIRAADLLISRANTRELVGSAAVALVDHSNLMLCDKLFRLRFGASICSPHFVAAYLSIGKVRGQIELAATGASSSMLNIGQSTILEMEIALPDSTEQAAIFGFLQRETAKLDNLMAEQEKLIALLKEKRQAVISHAVTKGFDPTVPMKDSGVEWLGEVPAHWRVIALKYLASIRSGGTPSKNNLDYWDGEIPWASAKDLKVDRLSDTGDHITQDAIDAGYALVPVNSVLVVVRGMILAKAFPAVQADVPMAINQDLKALVPFEGIDSRFLCWLLRASGAESMRRTDEAGHGTKALRMDVWESMPLPLPNFEEQLAIAKFLDQETKKHEELIAEAQKAIGLLKERRTALISAAVTGQIDVRGQVKDEQEQAA